MKKRTKLLGSAVLSILLASGFSGCGSSEDSTPATTPAATETTVSPYQRVAVISGTWADVPVIAEKIAKYTVYTDETAALGLRSKVRSKMPI